MFSLQGRGLPGWAPSSKQAAQLGEGLASAHTADRPALPPASSPEKHWSQSSQGYFTL